MRYMGTISDVLAAHGLRDEEPWIAELLDEYLRERWSRASVGLPAADRALLEAGGLAFGETPPELTDREREILRLLADGRAAQDVADLVGVEQASLAACMRSTLQLVSAFSWGEARPPQPASTAAFLRLVADSLTANEVAVRLGVDVSRVRHRIADRQLYAMRKGGGVRIPMFQFGADGKPLPGLALVLAAIPRDAHPLSVAGFFETTQPELVDEADVPMTPVQWLDAGGDPTLAVDLAAGAFGDV